MTVPNVTIVSPFRDNAGQVAPFAWNVNRLDYPEEHLRTVAIEGDSTDNTYDLLKEWADADRRVSLDKYDTGEKKWPSVVDKRRFAHLAKVFNRCIEAPDWRWSDYSLFIPSDTSFVPELVSALVMAEKDVISPFFWVGDHPSGFRFYDIWGFIREGSNFRGYSAQWYDQHLPKEPIEMDFVGGAMLCSKRVIEAGCRYTADEADHGLCRTAKEKGFSIWAHPSVYIVHR